MVFCTAIVIFNVEVYIGFVVPFFSPRAYQASVEAYEQRLSNLCIIINSDSLLT